MANSADPLGASGSTLLAPAYLSNLLQNLIFDFVELQNVLFFTSTFTVKFLNFRTSENFAVIYLKFKQRGQSLRYFVKKMQME